MALHKQQEQNGVLLELLPPKQQRARQTKHNLDSDSESLTYKDLSDKELRKDIPSWENDEIMKLVNMQAETINKLKGQSHLFRQPAFCSKEPKRIIKPGTSRVSFP